MDQYLNNRQQEILWDLLANPADSGSAYISNLQRFADEFPQSGLLHILLMRADDSSKGHAAAYCDPRILYTAVNYPESLADVDDIQIVQKVGHYSTAADIEQVQEAMPVFHDDPNEEIQAEPEIEPLIDLPEDNIAPAPVIEEETQTLIEPLFGGDDDTGDYLVEHEPVQEIETEPTGENEIVQEFHDETEAIIESPAKEDEDVPASAHESAAEHYAEVAQIAELPAEDLKAETELPVFEEEVTGPGEHHGTVKEDEPVEAAMPEEDHRAETDFPVFEEEVMELPADTEEETTIAEQTYAEDVSADNIDDEVYDEIVGIENIAFTPIARPVNGPTEPAEIAAALPEETTVSEAEVQPEAEQQAGEDTGNPEYFLFDRETVEISEPEPAEMPLAETVSEREEHPEYEPTHAQAENKEVSRYDDDKMPYTFLWWLNKTRKEHSGIYQPFKLDTTQAIRHTADDTLQQQYYENIFHVSTIEELEKASSKPTIQFDMKNKGDRIIQKFLTEDPQIGPPSSDKLDNENKAKRSAEDQDELVTETLARIYVDQMLYHKAINTYKKLILKFPEKSRYFADQIELLERKIN
ncbi:MAG TPA: hypothetical protein VHC47_00595 [Mucilaginibacter sp.]|nr:hypothetical protein [Mucilaginibacter sp.]